MAFFSPSTASGDVIDVNVDVNLDNFTLQDLLKLRADIDRRLPAKHLRDVNLERELTTVPEPYTAGGEVAWVSGGTYAAGDERTSNGAIWLCRQAHNARTAAPAADPVYWLRSTVTEAS